MSDSPPLTDSDTSDTERELASMLDSYVKEGGNQVNNPFPINEQQESTRMTIPTGLTSRVKRASNEPIRIISSEMIHYLKQHEYKVRGSKGKIYSVTIGPKIHCSCIDHTTRAIHCKHILYILLKELQVHDLSSVIYVTLFPSDQLLNDIYSNYYGIQS
ncbi:MAG: hypothetical protein EXX96DRAFT_582804 [Benjaminiella poitrasii]|nr:MAG: hypothetical protein EXX96DRAFT_582804 [Benjaminiella poitrasii]